MKRRFLRAPRLGLFVVVALLGSPCVARAEPISFRNEVMAVLSRGGCNQGACHGNQNGKNGFKLSLRGQDPDFDLTVLTRDALGRRLDRNHPEESLVLIKATGAMAHEGGKRFGINSDEYRILRGWIAEGAHGDGDGAPVLKSLDVSPRQQVLVEPADRVTLRVTATFSDGRTRDVTKLAVFETSNLGVRVHADAVVERRQLGETTVLVRYLDRQAAVQLAFVPARPDFMWKEPPHNNYIDKHVFAKLKTLRTLPSDLCSDTVFVRRAYLDALGVPPTVAEVRKFIDDPSADKRARVIDALLERPEFADFWALKWSDLLRNEEKALDHKGVQLFHQWIRASIAEGQPLNEFARELVAARGSTYSNPAANYYRALRDPYTRAEATAQVFLGIRMQCAKCHNHPFERWTQQDYHQFAALFTRVDYRIVENNRKDKLDKHEFDGEQIVYMERSGELAHPVTKEPLKPKFLGTATPDFAEEDDRLLALADWIARPDNPYFARAQVNRIWYHLLGRGLVDPNDDFRASNPPSNAALLDELAKDFADHHCDLRQLVRTIMNSRTYQLSAVPNDTNRDDETNFSHALIRPLQAEQLLDAVSQATGVPAKFNGFPLGTRAGQLPGVGAQRARGERPTDSEKFLYAFGKPVRSLSCECERSDDTTLNQAFQLITGEILNRMLTEEDNRLGKLLASGKATEAIVEELYLATLCRPPSPRERERTLALVKRAKTPRAGLEDALWGLLNAKEFLLRQ
jgi:hypothetical protein